MNIISYKNVTFGIIVLSGLLIIFAAITAGFLNEINLYNFDYLLISIGSIMVCFPLLLNKITEIDFNKRTAKFEQSDVDKFKEDVVDDVVEGVRSSIQDIATVGSEHMDHNKAFNIAIDLLKKYSDAEEVAVVDLRLISVALCYSWEFIENEFVPVARQNKNIQYSWKIAVVDPDYLNSFKFDKKQYDWNKQSSDIVGRIRTLEKKLKNEGIDNVSFEVFLYNSIPQWHGLLIDRTHLLIGRSDWELTTESGDPRLTVGSNAYRYYNISKSYGQLRINLFRHWFGFYADFKNLYAN